MSDVEFADWRASLQNPDYQIEFTHYEYATIGDMRKTLDALKNKLLLVQSEE